MLLHPLRPLFLLLLLMAAASCEARRRRTARHRQHHAAAASEEDSANQLVAKHHDEQEECHRGALHKCGQTFLRATKLLNFLDNNLVAFRTRCGVRTAFFECLKSTRDKICSGRRLYRPHLSRAVESDFRKKLTDSLWSTRVCVLGIKSFAGQHHNG